MILLDMKNSKTVSSPLNLSASKDKPLLSFSDLLRGASEKKEGGHQPPSFLFHHQ